MKKLRGSALVCTLFFVVLILMLSILIAKQGRDAIVSGSMLSQSRQAEIAALSGIEYVKGRLFYDKSWGTDTLGTSFTDTASHTKIEFGSNNTGKYIKGSIGSSEDGSYSSEFSILFSGNAPNTRTAGFFKNLGICEYGSVNNLSGESDIDSGYYRKVPSGSFYVVSKGVCGNCVRYAEAMFESAGPSVINGGTTIGGQISIKAIAESEAKDLGYSYSDAKDSVDSDGNHVYNKFLYISRADSNAAGQITSFKPDSSSQGNSIEISCGNIPLKSLISADADHRVIINSSDFSVGNGGNLVSYDNIPDEEKPDGLSHNIQPSVDADDIGSLSDFNSVIDGYDNGSSVSGGTFVYVMDKSGSDKVINEWKYVNSSVTADEIISRLNLSDSSITDANSIFPSSKETPPVIFGSPSKVTSADGTALTSRDRTVSVNGNVKFGSDTSFIIVNKDASGDYCLKNSFDSIDFSMRDGSLICDGNLSIEGEVTGTGKIFANGNVSFNAGSSLETKPQSGVAIWAADDVNIEPPVNISNQTINSSYDITDSKKDYTGTQGIPIIETSNIDENSFANIKIVSSGDYNQLYVNNDLKLEFYQSEPSFWNFFTSKLCYNKPNEKSKTTDKNKKIELDDVIIDNIEYKVSLTPILTNGGKVTDFELIFKPQGGKDNKGDDKKGDDKKGENKETNIYFDVDGNTLPRGYGASKDSSVGSKNLKFKFVVTDKKTNQYFSDNSLRDYIDSNGNFIADASANNNTQNTPVTVKELQVKVQTAPTSLKGTVYSSNGNININGGNSEFSILGALITNNGNLSITDIARIMLMYDPDYVPFFNDKGIITKKVFERVF